MFELFNKMEYKHVDVSTLAIGQCPHRITNNSRSINITSQGFNASVHLLRQWQRATSIYFVYISKAPFCSNCSNNVWKCLNYVDSVRYVPARLAKPTHNVLMEGLMK